MKREDGRGPNHVDLKSTTGSWKREPLENFVDWITYGFTNPMPTVEEGPYMLTAKDLEGNRINYDSARRTSASAYDDRLTEKSKPHPNDVLLSKDGTLGRVAIVDDRRVCISQSVALLRPNSRILPKYLYYLLQSPHYQSQMTIDSDGTTISHIYITRVGKMQVEVPQREEQLGIVEILGGLDAKLELNRAMDLTLQELVKAIFEHWFVDFEFPNEKDRPYRSSGGKVVFCPEFGQDIPQGWSVNSLDKVAKFLNGLALQRYPVRDGEEELPVVKIRELRQGITQSTDRASNDIPEDYVVDDGDLLFSWSGSLEVTIWTSGKGALNQHLFKVTSADFPMWYCHQWILRYLPMFRRIAEGKATTMGHIQRQHLTDSLVLVPGKQTLQKMDEVLGPLSQKQIQLGIESRNISELRSLLLPKLVAGKVRVALGAS